jgi:ABC-type thiamine transport system ATPase subunit
MGKTEKAKLKKNDMARLIVALDDGGVAEGSQSIPEELRETHRLSLALARSLERHPSGR